MAEEKEEKSKGWGNPEWMKLLGDVQYQYSNRLAMNINEHDVRLAFGDQLPNGEVVPRCGLIISHLHARSVLELLQSNIKTLDAALAKMNAVEAPTK
jgi:hypothetical protein